MTCDLNVAFFNIPFVYDFITESCRQQAEVIQNHVNATVHNIVQGKAMQRKYIYKRLELGGSQAYDHSSD